MIFGSLVLKATSTTSLRTERGSEERREREGEGEGEGAGRRKERGEERSINICTGEEGRAVPPVEDEGLVVDRGEQVLVYSSLSVKDEERAR
eukprot:753434-Hanusia_phi.AAC.2